MTEQGLFQEWLTLWQTRPLSGHVLSAVAGFVGAGVYAAIASPKVMMWRWDRKARTFHLGFLSNIIIGVTAAVVTDIAFPISVMAAFIAPTVLALVQKRVLPGLAEAVLIMLQKRLEATRSKEGDANGS